MAEYQFFLICLSAWFFASFITVVFPYILGGKGILAKDEINISDVYKFQVILIFLYLLFVCAFFYFIVD